MTLSRRGFLQAAGISLAATQLTTVSPLAALVSGRPLIGRVLEPVSIGGQTLWPDSTVTIQHTDTTHYHLSTGRVPHALIQPMTVDRDLFDERWPDGPFTAEVSAPVAVVYRSADVSSRPVARIGHAGVLTVRETLPDEAGTIRWLAVNDAAGQALGWTQAAHWMPTAFTALPAPVEMLHLDLTAQTLTALCNGEPLLVSAIATHPDVRFAHAESQITHRQPHADAQSAAIPFGTPWVLTTQHGTMIAGAHWHNRFGTPQPGPAIQLPPAVAKWLYSAQHEAVRLHVI